MPMASNPNLYLYHAHGHALSASFTRPMTDLVDAQAATSLSVSGGHGSASVSNFSFRNFISMKAATSHVAGSKDANGHHNSSVSICIEGLNIMDVVTADRIVARLAARHEPGKKEPAIVLAGSHFDNLRIAGNPVTVEIDHDLFNRINTFDLALKELAKNPAFKKNALDPFESGKPQPKPDTEGALLCSCVKTLSDAPGAEKGRHWFTVPQFGTLYIGETHLSHQKRRLTMLRVVLGSPVEGTVVALDGQTNGAPWPP